jgi:IS5 family transposase
MNTYQRQNTEFQKKGAERKREAAVYKEPVKHLEYIGHLNRERYIECMKSKVRSKAEHIFYIVKRLFGYRKAVYRGLAKNTGRLYMLFAGANLLKWARPLSPYERPAAV